VDEPDVPKRRPFRLRYDGQCGLCGRALARGTSAVWDPGARKLHCIVCPPAADSPYVPKPVQEAVPLELGVAGRSARSEFERRANKRHAANLDRWGNRVGGWVNRLTDEPQSTRAWAKGAVGEERLAEALEKVEGLFVLHDRRARRTRGNIDHLVVGPAGVFVIDSKRYNGTVELRDVGGFFRSDIRLFVGGREKSALADAMTWQVDAVTAALMAGRVDPMPPVLPVLCFIDANWPLFRTPDEFRGVRLESERSILNLLSKVAVIDADRAQVIARVLASAFPPK
jgi:hypothetical protein